MSKNPLRFALVSALAALVAGCGGSDAPQPVDPLARYKNQTVQWNDCSAYLEQDPEGYARKLGPRLQCAQVQVPQDYQNPDAAAVMVSIMRVRAAQAPDKKPLLQPGRPWGRRPIPGAVFLASFRAGQRADGRGQEVPGNGRVVQLRRIFSARSG